MADGQKDAPGGQGRDGRRKAAPGGRDARLKAALQANIARRKAQAALASGVVPRGAGDTGPDLAPRAVEPGGTPEGSDQEIPGASAPDPSEKD